MNKRVFKIIGISLISLVLAIYLIFLLAPFILNPIIKGYAPQIKEEIKKSTGFNSEIEEVKLVTTPKLTTGLKIGKFSLLTSENNEIMNAEDFQVKMSLVPLIRRKIEIDVVSLENLDLKLNIDKDGNFKDFESLLNSENEENNSENKEVNAQYLPFGLKLSNHLPNIKIGGYNISFVDLETGKKYVLSGNKTKVTDFVLNKGVKVSADGKFTLDEREQFVYNLKINNKIMPDIDLNELVFNPQTEEEEEENNNSEFKINIIDIFKGLYNYAFTANLDTDLTLTKEGQNGYIKIDNLSVSPNGIKLPPSDINLKLKENKTDIKTNLYSAQNEVSTVNGTVEYGKNTKIDLNVKSDAELSNIVKILNATAMTFNIKDLQTLSANGKIDADFNIKSNLKTVKSNGHLKIPTAKVYYGLYDVAINNINTDITLNDNDINIKNISFSILNQPLKVYGTITQDAKIDLHVLAQSLGLKGLLVACSQTELLKENTINSGTVNLNIDIAGKLNSIKPVAKIGLNNLDIKNIPSSTSLKLPKTNIDITAEGESFSGTAVSENLKILNSGITVSVPKISANIDENSIEITQTPVTVEKINFKISGKIKNYMSEKINLDFVTTGDINSTLSGYINILKQTLNLNFVSKESNIIIPMFDKSKMSFNGNVSITGKMTNPILSGTVNVPSLNIPEIPVVMSNLVAKLNGAILNGNATLEKFSSGGIVGENISSDFSLKGDNFYLKNLKGTAFSGKVSGDIIYNIVNAKTSVNFKGENMNAESAILGATGIKNALSGTLNFDTKLTLTVADYDEMMRSLGGKMSFKVLNGSFGSIGRFENFLNASNIIGNTILKSTVSSLSNLSGIKDTAQFDYINGEMSFSKGWANISSIKSTGKTLAYYVTGKYNLLNGTTNVIILGRLDSTVVSLLGPIGSLSADKLLSAIPKFGSLTSSIVKTMTTNPNGENTSELPSLNNENNSSKDFKVVFNGGIENTSSIKSFKWLTNVDTSALEQTSAVETIKSLKTNVSSDINTTVQTVKENVETQKEALKTTVSDLKNSANELKNTANELKNLFKSK